jgi:hypothetical protein
MLMAQGYEAKYYECIKAYVVDSTAKKKNASADIIASAALSACDYPNLENATNLMKDALSSEQRARDLELSVATNRAHFRYDDSNSALLAQNYRRDVMQKARNLALQKFLESSN